MKKEKDYYKTLQFIEEELYRAKKAIFYAKKIKHIKFLQKKIVYLEEMKKRLEE